MRVNVPLLIVTLIVIAAASSTGWAQGRAPAAHQLWNSVIGPLTAGADGFLPAAGSRIPVSPICSTETSAAANVDTDCGNPAPHNETSIAVNPKNALNLIASVNDYQLALTPGGKVYETVYSRAHVSFDGGQTWALSRINYNPYTSTGDPGVAFDADGTAYLSTLGFTWSQSLFCCVNPDVLVAHSSDGGENWSLPMRAASGTGVFTSPGISNDKPYLAAWGHGNAIVTWTVFNQGVKGSYISSPIFASVTHDGGNTWSAPVEISGSASFCMGAQGGTACNQSQGSVPTVAKDGSIYVSFFSLANQATGRDQYLVVKVDPDTGKRIGGPFKVADLFDGNTDYPINIDGRATYQDSEFRTWAFGNIAADPTNASHLAVIWSDMRNSTLPAPSNPYSATTNSDIIVSQSTDGGQTWSAPTAIVAPGDQFMPWGAYDAGGKLRIGYFDRSYDPDNHKYGYTLATETSPGSLSFTTTQLTTALSDPTQGTRWFSGITPNPAFPHPTTFLGDYGNIVVTTTGYAYWTDMRQSATFPSRTGSGEDAFFATF